MCCFRFLLKMPFLLHDVLHAENIRIFFVYSQIFAHFGLQGVPTSLSFVYEGTK